MSTGDSREGRRLNGRTRMKRVLCIGLCLVECKDTAEQEHANYV